MTDLFKDIPVCNSFHANILNDQLCYEVDLEKLSKNGEIKRFLKTGLTFIMDYNEDRQITFHQAIKGPENNISLGTSIDEWNHAVIYLNTVGKKALFVVH